MTSKPKLYVGCSLTHAPEAFKQQIKQLKITLNHHYEIFEFVGLISGTEQGVYQWDVGQCIPQSDVVLAICDYPSLGLGYEIATAVERHHKPVLAVAHADARVTRLILGVQAPGYTFKRYQNMAEIPNLLQAHLAALTPLSDIINET